MKNKFLLFSLGFVIVFFVAFNLYLFFKKTYIPSALLCYSGVNTVHIDSNRIEFKDGVFWLLTSKGATVPYVKSAFESCFIMPLNEMEDVKEKRSSGSISNDSNRSTMHVPFIKEKTV